MNSFLSSQPIALIHYFSLEASGGRFLFLLVASVNIPWVPEGFFFRGEAAIVSGEAADPAKREKKNPLDAAVTNLTSMRTCFNLGR